MALPGVVSQFARERFGEGVEVELTPLRGGLEAVGIARATVRKAGVSAGSFVAKPFRGAGRRELDVYRLLSANPEHRLAPALLGWSFTDEQETCGYMFLEWVSAQRRWPWRDLGCAALVVDRLAMLHRLNPASSLGSLAWNYEQELLDSARSTLDLYREAFLLGVRPGGRPMLPAFERLIERLPRLRRDLMNFAGATLVHGDAHPGNVLMKGTSALLLDWGRARIGSPLEDLSSWVHSLAFWEPEAKRKHDTLLTRYRCATGSCSTRVSSEFRDAIVLAGATNALAGALRYHLAVAMDPASTPRRQCDSYRAAADWLRLIRRADACFAR